MKCQVCGRTEDELSEEFGREVEVKEHQGIDKCDKCIKEYQREMGEESSEDESENYSGNDWKKAVTA